MTGLAGPRSAAAAVRAPTRLTHPPPGARPAACACRALPPLAHRAEFRNDTYAKYGAEVLRQPERVAAQVFDAQTVGLLRPIDHEAPGAARVDADTLGELRRCAVAGRGTRRRSRRARRSGHRRRVLTRARRTASSWPSPS